MMAISDDSINVEITLDEIKILDNLLRERLYELEENLAEVDSHKYIVLMQLEGKIEGLKNLISNKKNCELAKTKMSNFINTNS